MKNIEIQGARTHNLKNINVTIPRDQLVVITGPSGSGKSSIAFDTLYAEGQRRYVESLSAYARQFLSVMEKPDVDQIDGLSPAIAIDQKSTSHNPRSTVGTITEIYDYLRLLFARVGEPRCPEHDIPLTAQTISQIIDALLKQPVDSKMMILAPVIRNRKGTHEKLFTQLRKDGFIRVRINGTIYELEDIPELNKNKKHDIEVVVDRLKIREDMRVRLADSIETAFNLADDIVHILIWDAENKVHTYAFSGKHACPKCGYSIPELEPRLFSFNSPAGACPSCEGLGLSQFFDPENVIRDPALTISAGAIKGWDRRNSYYYSMLEGLAKHYKFSLNTPWEELSKDIQEIILYGSDDLIKFHYTNDRGTDFKKSDYFEGVINNIERRYRETDSQMVRDDLGKLISETECPDCHGTRLNEHARQVFINSHNLPDLAQLTIIEAIKFFNNLKLTGKRAAIAEKILKEICERLKFLNNVGLSYLTLMRSANTLSGGESQRIRLASQIGSALVGVMYVLDEPSIGLHQRDNQKLLATLTALRDIGNTVIIVEHDEEAIRSADHIIDIGPGAGKHGGTVVAEGPATKIAKSAKSLTGKYLSGKLKIEVDQVRLKPQKDKYLKIHGAKGNNLKNINAEIPLGLLTCITGVSGSGKSTLINQTLYPIAARTLNKATQIHPQAYKKVSGLDQLDKVIDIDQSPIGRTPRSNPATYTGLFTPIRDLFAQTQEARSRGYKAGRFSFNVKGGRCEACEGDGVIKVEMHFLSDLYVKCDVCQGKRYNESTLEIKFKDKNIYEILEMTVEEAAEFFTNIPVVKRKLDTLISVGLSYIKLGQAATTFSGGEAQRIKLAKELSKRDTGHTLYILDEPTTGLHFHDIKQLLEVLHKLKEKGNTLVVIEHNLDVIKTADWIIDLGPEGGDGGGKIIATGCPEDVAKAKGSYTGKFLKQILENS